MIRFNEWVLLAAIVVVVLVTGAIDSNHTYFRNPGQSALEIARYTALLGIFALGATVVIIAGGIDLSTGSTIAFSATVCGATILVLGDVAVKPHEARRDAVKERLHQQWLVPLEQQERTALEGLDKKPSDGASASGTPASSVPASGAAPAPNAAAAAQARAAAREALKKEFSQKRADARLAIENDADYVLLKNLAAARGTAVALFGMVAAVLSGLLVGTLHAWLITSLRLPPFIATLATLVGLRSFARILCDGVTAPRNLVRAQINVSDAAFTYLNRNVWVPVAAFAILAVFTWFLLSRTLLGRHIYALGGNEQAARLSGIRTTNVKWFAYCFASVTASLAGVFVMGQELVAAPVNQGRGYELNAIAAAVVGGCSLQGGVGTVLGTFLGALFLRLVIDSVAKVIKSGADMYEGLIVGSVVVAAVTFTQLRQLWASGKELFPGALGIFSIVTISLLAAVFATCSGGYVAGAVLGSGFALVLAAIKTAEVIRTKRV